MEAKKLYEKLEKDFVTPELQDKWMEEGISEIEAFLSENFKRRSMGLVCDFSQKINKVYTAVFPSDPVMRFILDRNEKDALLFVHHPMIWDIRKSPKVFQNMKPEFLDEFRKRKISVFNFHVPLDNYGPYSTGTSYANALGIKIEKPFGHYFGCQEGIFGKTEISDVKKLKEKVESVLGHRAVLYDHGSSKIKNNVVAIITGGGNSIDELKEVSENGVNTYITGVTIFNDYAKKSHQFAEKHNINVIGGTHYSTEKFACQSMCSYFIKLGLKSEFISDKPVMEDL